MSIGALALVLSLPMPGRAEPPVGPTPVTAPSTAVAINDEPGRPDLGGTIVVFDDTSAMERAADDLRARGTEPVEELPAVATLIVDDPADATHLDRSHSVESVEPVQVFELAAPPPSWGLDRIDQRHLPLDQATFPAGGGAGVTAYVLDSGIRGSHVEFAGRIPRAAYFDFGDGTGAEDCRGHGTHVAGILGGSTVGVARAVSIVPVKAFDCSSQTTSAIVLGAMNWIIADHAAGVPAVVNLSFSGDPSPAVDAGIAAMIADGITVVVAAGNDAVSSCDVSPGRVAEAITVAASTTSDSRAAFSNVGPCNDLFAPGVDITSAWIGGDTATAVLSGTSMATPHVAGAAALELQARPTASPAEVWAAIDAATTPFAVTGCCDDPTKLLHIGELGVPPTCAFVPGHADWWRAEDSLLSVSGSTLQGEATYGPGRAGRGWVFDASSPSLGGAGVPIDEAMSIEAWIEPLPTSVTQVVVGRWTFASERDDDRSYALLLEPGGVVAFVVDDPGTRRPTEVRAQVDPARLFDGVPHHIAATWAAATSTLYVDGVAVASAVTAGGPLQPASEVPFEVADANGPVRFPYVGMLDELTIYVRALTAAEVSAIVRAGRTGKCLPTVPD